jgi:hypothetical protein
LTISNYFPAVLSDENEFLAGFLDTDFLTVLGFMISISLASAVNIHFKLIDYTEKSGKPLPGTMAAIRKSCISLVLVFILALVLVILKPVFACSKTTQGFFNSFAIAVLYFNISVMYDLLNTALKIPPFIGTKK